MSVDATTWVAGQTEDCIFDKNPKGPWDDGLNAGLIFRPAGQKAADSACGNMIYNGPARPAYYAESKWIILFAKAILMAGVTIVPYFTILDQLGATVDFVPCNDFTCHYMRMFNSKNIPATGTNVIGIQNGVDRPVAMYYNAKDEEGLATYSCEQSFKNRTYTRKVYGEESGICPPAKKADYESFLEKHASTKARVTDESNFARHNWTTSVKASFLITKIPLWILAWPVNQMAKYNPKWGMEHIPSARCPKMTPDKMRETCVNINSLNKKHKSGTEEHQDIYIQNHLKPLGPSKIGVYVGLAGYAVFTAMHDIFLMLGFSERITLTLGFTGIMFYGLGTFAIFFWAMGASEVFVAPVPGHAIEECACYYQMPDLSALIALTTPFMMFIGFMTKVQMQGLAALFGDYLSFQAYLIPHYLGKQSFLWTWSVLTTPKMAGTIEGKPREIFTGAQWAMLRRQQTCLYWCTIAVKTTVALVAASFMIAFKELCNSLYMSHDMTPMLAWFVKWVLMFGPSVFTLFIGFQAIADLKGLTITTDTGETFFSQVRNMCPCIGNSLQNFAKSRQAFEQTAAWFTFILGSLAMSVWTLAAAQGLSPDRSFLLGNEELVRPKLAQAEMWGSCGFVFFLVHVPTILSVAFSTWDDLESLKHLETQKTAYDAAQGKYVVNTDMANSAGTNFLVTEPTPAYAPLCCYGDARTGP